jgi:hypothetical protein
VRVRFQVGRAAVPGRRPKRVSVSASLELLCGERSARAQADKAEAASLISPPPPESEEDHILDLIRSGYDPSLARYVAKLRARRPERELAPARERAR